MNTPEVIPRSSWGAKPPRRNHTYRSTTRYIVWHHTVSPGCGILPHDQEIKAQRTMQAYHTSSKFGAIDIAQHYTVYQSGRIYEGRPHNVVGAHAGTSHANAISIGIEHQGNFNLCRPTAQQLDASVRLIAWLCTVYSLSESAIRPHSDFVATSCPGKYGKEAIEQYIRPRVAELIHQKEDDMPGITRETGAGPGTAHVYVGQYKLANRVVTQSAWLSLLNRGSAAISVTVVMRNQQGDQVGQRFNTLLQPMQEITVDLATLVPLPFHGYVHIQADTWVDWTLDIVAL